MKKILVPTDFSKFAEMATEMAIIIAQKSDAEIHFVHLMDIPIDWINLVGEEQKRLYPDISLKVKTANSKLEALAKKAQDQGLATKTLIQFNANYKHLIDYTEMFDCDLIVMGSHGSSGIAEWFMGSNTQRVVRRSKVPVLTVKHTYKSAKFLDIVFASDFDQDKLSPFKWILDFTQQMGTKIHLLFINMPSDFVDTPIIEEKMKTFMEEGGDLVSGSSVFNYYDFEEGLLKFLDGQSRLIAMVTHSENNVVTERVINHIDLPILSIRI